MRSCLGHQHAKYRAKVFISMPHVEICPVGHYMALHEAKQKVGVRVSRSFISTDLVHAQTLKNAGYS